MSDKKSRARWIIGQRAKQFGLLLPVCACAAGSGMVHDMRELGEGTRGGLIAAMLLVGFFFVCLILSVRDIK